MLRRGREAKLELGREERGGAGAAQALLTQSPWRPSSQKIALQLKATLENVTNLRPVGEDFRWYLKVRLEGRGSRRLGCWHFWALVGAPRPGSHKTCPS